MSFQTVSHFAQSWGLVFLLVMFGSAVVYAMWPSNKGKFKKAAHLPLEED